MGFAAAPPDPLDALRAELERAADHLDLVRRRVEAGDLDGNALAMAELRRQHAEERWQDAVRGDPPPGGAAA